VTGIEGGFADTVDHSSRFGRACNRHARGLRRLFAAATFRACSGRRRDERHRPPQQQTTSVSLDRSTVKTIAYLARLRVADDQLEGLVQELSGILHWVEQLGEVNTDGVEPMTSVVAMTLPQRDDRITDGGDRRAVLANAPAVIDDYYSVPKVVE
jgi:aspartyl-tRNA(Asn)/glutamyl-tRNA(Gln) amidotransferase subunit C